MLDYLRVVFLFSRIGAHPEGRYISETISDYSEKWIANSLIHLGKALELDPGHKKLLLLKAKLLTARRDFQGALDACSEYIKLYPEDHAGYLERAKTFNKYHWKMEKTKDEYFDDFDKIIELVPELPEAYIERGEFLYDLGVPKAGIKDFRKAAELDPNSVQPYVRLAWCHGLQRKNEELLEQLKKALELDSRIGQVLYLVGDYFVV